VSVSGDYIYPFGIDDNDKWNEFKIALPKLAQNFIKVFDALSEIPYQRLRIPEFEFEISLPDEIITEINIDEVKTLTYMSSLYP